MIKEFFKNLYRKFRPIQISGTENNYHNESKLGKGFIINMSGNNNSIEIGKDCLLTNTIINMGGGNNRIIIENNVRFIGPCLIKIEGNNSTLHIKWNAGIRGVEFNLNSANIEIGELCMFSYGITLRNHDSHKLLDRNNKIINPPRDIVLGKHIWIAQNATILKGCHIGDNSIIGFGAIVTKSCSSGSVMAGMPAKVVRENITWDY